VSKDEEKSEGEESLDPALLLKDLQSKAQTNKFILFASVALFIITLCILATGYSVLYLKVSSLEAGSMEDVDTYVEDIQEQLASMEAYKENEVVSIIEMEEKIGLLREDYQSHKVIAMKRVFLDREADFQRLIDTLLSSTESLSAMILGSREWVEYHKQEMQALKKRSIARASAIQATMPDPNNKEQASDDE